MKNNEKHESMIMYDQLGDKSHTEYMRWTGSMGDMGLDVSPSLDVISLENCESMVDPMLLEYTYNTYTYIYI